MALAKKKQILIGVGVGVVILAAAVAAYLVFIQQQTSSVKTQTAEQEVKVADYVARGDYKKIQAVYDQRIDQAGSKEDKAKLSFEAASFIVGSAGDDATPDEAMYRAALQYALAAEETLKTPQSAAQVGQIYYELKDQAKSDEFFKLAVERGEG